MSFIGAGAIVRKGDMVRGLTTAASLWFATVLGLCFGGGQLLLGSAVLCLGLIVLEGLKWVEKRRKQDRHAALTIVVGEGGPTDDEVAASLEEKGYEVEAWAVRFINSSSNRELQIELRWRAYFHEVRPATFLDNLADRAGVVKVEWNP
jgi:putative Mg2+ transporter-C (MgtC) family protein